MNNNEKCTDNSIKDVAAKLKILGHPVRLKILCIIMHQNSCVSELWKCLNQPQPVVSQHLAQLKKSGIVSSTTEGNKRIYRIIDPMVVEILKSCQPED